MAKHAPYDRNSTEPYALSRIAIEGFVQCPRCFVLDRRHKVKPPFGPSFTLNTAVDSLLKKEFDVHREAGTVHEVVKQLGYNFVPLQDSNMDAWRTNFVGVRYLHEATNFEVTGAIDDLWVNDAGEIVVIDYKATAKATPVEELGTKKWHDAYRRQLEIYQWLLRSLGYKVSTTGYWLYETARNDAPEFNQRLDFDARLISHQGNTDWIEPTLLEIKKALDADDLAPSSDKCEMCRFVTARAEITNA